MAPVKEFKESWLQQKMLKAAGELAKASSYDLAKETELVENFFESSLNAVDIPEPVALAVQNEMDAIEVEGLDYLLPDTVNNANGLRSAARLFGNDLSIYIGAGNVEEPVPPAPQCREECSFSWADKNPPSFDVSTIDNSYAMQIGLQQFEGLLNFAAGNGPPEPGAASHYSVSEDGLRYTFYLRRDAKWSNGRPVVADDFVYSWRRVLDPNTAAETAANLMMLKNAESFIKGKVKDLNMVGVHAIGEHILEIELEFPMPNFPSVVCHPTFTPVPHEVVEKHGKNWARPGNIVVNGPYKLSEHKENDNTIFVKNDAYWNVPAVQIETITIRYTNDPATQFRLYESGQIDWATSLPSGQIRDLSNRTDFRTDPTMAVYELAFKMDHVPLNNPLVRGALSMAIDREMLIRQVIPGLGEIAVGFMPSVFQTEPPTSSLHNPDEAHRLLAEAGFAGGNGLPTLIISTVSTDPFNSNVVAEFIQRKWKEKLGVNVEIENLDLGTVFGKLRKGDYQISRESYAAPFPDYMRLFDRFTDGNPENFQGYKNPEYDELIDRANREPDQERRDQIIKEAERLLRRDLPSIPLFYPRRTYLLRQNITGFEPNKTQKHLVKYIRRK